MHQPQYLPWLGYFHKIQSSDHFVYLDCVQYKEREFQNRNKIRTDRGWMWLTVPVISSHRGRQAMRDVRIDNSMPWQRKHRESVRVNYAGCPFFENYYPFFDKVYSAQWDFLIDLNIHVIQYLMREFRIQTPVSNESALCTTSRKTERIIELCLKLKADTYLSGVGGRDYLEDAKFNENHIKLIFQQFTALPYNQRSCDSGPFIPNLSAVDLLFNEGPDSHRFIRARP